MIELQVLTVSRKTINSRGIVEPLWRARNLLRDHRIILRKEARTPTEATGTDFLIIDSKVFKNQWARRREWVLEQLTILRRGNGKLIWFDSGDSSGNIILDVFDHVDLYLKGQLLKEKTNYRTSYYGGRIFTEFFNRELGIIDSNEVFSAPLGDAELEKLRLGWNYGLAQGFGSNENKLASYLEPIFALLGKRKKNVYTSPDKSRTNSVSMRINTNYARETVGIQRKLAVQEAERLSVAQGRIQKRAYLREMQNSRAIISPFGWGEIAIRDFECFAAGATLVKPSIEHLSTFPPYYESDVTYRAIPWDIGKLDNVIELFRDNSKCATAVAKSGQDRFRYYTESEQGREAFVDHFLTCLRHLEAVQT